MRSLYTVLLFFVSQTTTAFLSSTPKVEILPNMIPGSPKADKAEAMGGLLSPLVNEIVPGGPTAMSHKNGFRVPSFYSKTPLPPFMSLGGSKMFLNEQMGVLLSPCVVETVHGPPPRFIRTIFLFSTLKNYKASGYESCFFKTHTISTYGWLALLFCRGSLRNYLLAYGVPYKVPTRLSFFLSSYIHVLQNVGSDLETPSPEHHVRFFPSSV